MEQPNNQDNGDKRKAKSPAREGSDESTESSSGGININQQGLSNHHLGPDITHDHPSTSTLEQIRTTNYHRNTSAVASTSSNNVGPIFRPQSNWVQEYPSGSTGLQFRPNFDGRMSSQQMFQPNISSGASEEQGPGPNGSGINNMSGIRNSDGINNMRSDVESNGIYVLTGPWLVPEDTELKICSCKETECLKLYCACFSHEQYCCLNCKCQNCENTLDNEHVVAAAREKVLTRNPDAFSSKVVHNKTEVVIDDEGVEHVREVPPSRTKGCNCKTSNCAKAYCECYQKHLQCSILCKCTTCRNPHGKDGGNNQGSHVNMPENVQRQRPRSQFQYPPLPLSQPTIQIGNSNNISTTNNENYGLVHLLLQANQPQLVGRNIPHTTPSQSSNNGNNNSNILLNEMNGTNHGGMPADLHVNGVPSTQQWPTYAENLPNDLTGSSNNNHNNGNTECSGINSTVISTNGQANQTPNSEQLPASAEMETAPLQNSENVLPSSQSPVP